MNRIFALVAVLLAAVLIAGCCSHPVEVAALRDLESKQEKYFGKYGSYVDADSNLSAAEKNEIRGTLGAIQRQTRSVRKALEGEE